MCNNPHNTSQIAIPTEGFGYKLFTKVRRTKEKPFLLESMMGVTYKSYELDEKGWAVWREGYSYGIGFCFFVDREEAKKAAKGWIQYYDRKKKEVVILSGLNKLAIRKIRYKKAHPFSFLEAGMIDEKVRIALCREFKPVKGWQ